jgi:predicted HicB family RNase H-like nuclease
MKKEKQKPFNTISSRINPDIHKAVKVYCAKEDISVQSLFESALVRELEARRTGKK